MTRKAFKKIDLYIPLEWEGETSVDVSGGNKFLYSTAHRIPSPSEIGGLEIDLLKHGSKVVKSDKRTFIRTKDIVGRYDDGTKFRHLQYKVA